MVVNFPTLAFRYLLLFFYRMEQFSQLHEDVLNDEIREPEPIEDFCAILNDWMKIQGGVMPFYRCVGTSGSGPSLIFIMTFQGHHTSNLTIGRVYCRWT